MDMADWRYLLEERAAIYEFEGGYSREDAEIRAQTDIRLERSRGKND